MTKNPLEAGALGVWFIFRTLAWFIWLLVCFLAGAVFFLLRGGKS